jgi:hypothetical protein
MCEQGRMHTRTKTQLLSHMCFHTCLHTYVLPHISHMSFHTCLHTYVLPHILTIESTKITRTIPGKLPPHTWIQEHQWALIVYAVPFVKAVRVPNHIAACLHASKNGRRRAAVLNRQRWPEPYIYTLYIRYFWQGNHHISYIRSYTVYTYGSGQP